MKVLYVAPRYHMNQVPIVRGWIREGHEVLFISQIITMGEDHRDIKPVELGFSSVFNILFDVFCLVMHKTDPDEKFAIYSKAGFPPVSRLKKLIEGFKPDVAILRERSLYSITAHYLCKKIGIPCILYNQSPLWEKKRQKTTWLWKTVRKLSPKYRMTVSSGEEGPDMEREPHSYYVSFVMEPKIKYDEKTWLKDGIIHFLFVARFVEWKNHDVVLPVFKSLVEKGYPIHLTTVGQVESEAEREYFDHLVKYIEDNGLKETVTLIQNADRDSVFEEYKKADVFILPSRDPNSVSHLEAMSCSLPVICSDSPGKAAYVKNGQNGYLVEAGDGKALEDKMELMINDKDRLPDMGKKSYELIKENASFDNYYKSIVRIMDDMKNGR